MSKRLIQEGKPGEEERVVAKSKPMWSLVSSASHSPKTLKAQSSTLDLTSTGRPVARGLNENTATSSRHSVVNPNTSTRRPVAETTKNPIGKIFISPQLGDIKEQCWPSWESLLERTTKTWETTGLRSTSTR